MTDPKVVTDIGRIACDLQSLLFSLSLSIKALLQGYDLSIGLPSDKDIGYDDTIKISAVWITDQCQ